MILEERKIEAHGVLTNYKIAGTGPMVLILHGWRHNSQHWQPVQEILAQNGFQVIALDLPGFGLSQDPPRPWTIEDYKNFVFAFLRELNITSCHLIGHSFGGRITIKMAATNSPVLNKVVICDGAGINVVVGWKKKLVISFAQVFSWIFKNPILDPIYKKIQQMVYTALKSDDFLQVNETMRGVFLNANREDLRHLLPYIPFETLLVWGENDRLTPVENAYVMQREIKGAKLEIIKGVGHSPHVKEPQILANIIVKFLKSN